jgi:hypothetical protein
MVRFYIKLTPFSVIPQQRFEPRYEAHTVSAAEHAPAAERERIEAAGGWVEVEQVRARAPTCVSSCFNDRVQELTVARMASKLPGPSAVSDL